MVNAKYGVFVHYLNGLQNSSSSSRDLNQGKVTSWDQCVNEFNVNAFANDMADAGAGYVIFTLMQLSKHMCAPNTTYNTYTGYIEGQACSTRDLINDLYSSLNAKGIGLMLYTTGDGPALDTQAANGLGGWNGKTNPVFQSRWYNCMKEYSERYGSKVLGWWVDGCYTYFGYTDSSLSDYSAYLKSGNPKAVVAFNPGVQTIDRYVSADDYTCGERTDLDDLCNGRWIDDCQWHCLTFLGQDWGYTNTKYTNEQLIDYVRSIKVHQGAVTFDVGLYRDGTISSSQKNQLMSLKNAIMLKLP